MKRFLTILCLLVAFATSGVFAQWNSTGGILKIGKYTQMDTQISLKLMAAGMCSLSKGYQSLATGNYKIQGNKLYVTYTFASGPAASLQGTTERFNIIDDSTFTDQNDYEFEYVGAY